MERLSVSDKTELWDRYEAGESFRSIGLGRATSSIRTHLVAAGWERPVPAEDWCALRLLLGEREERFHGGWVARLRRCLVRSLAMVAVSGIGLSWDIKRRGGGHIDRNHPSLGPIRYCGQWWRKSLSCGGPHCKSLDGSSRHILTMRSASVARNDLPIPVYPGQRRVT